MTQFLLVQTSDPAATGLDMELTPAEDIGVAIAEAIPRLFPNRAMAAC